MQQIEDSSFVENARRIVALTGAAWRVPPLSARAAARRAPHGYVPARVARRMRAAEAALRPVLAYAW